MDSALVWYGLWLLLVATVFWAAVWWWLPALFRDRDERDAGVRKAKRDGRDAAQPDEGPGSTHVPPT